MDRIPDDYARIETSQAYKGAQILGARVSRKVELEEYGRFLDPVEINLLTRAKRPNVTFYIEEASNRYKLCVGLEGYVRVRPLSKSFFDLLPGHPPGIRGTAGRPEERKLKLHLPLQRQEEIFKKLRPEGMEAAIMAAFARELRTLMRVMKNSDVKIDQCNTLQEQYRDMLTRFLT